jgi:hypothetical protein
MAHLTPHARTRFQQRGFTNTRLEALLEHADVERPVGRNCRLLRVSRQACNGLLDGERLSRVAAIVSDDTGEIITIFAIHPGAKGRRYRAPLGRK